MTFSFHPQMLLSCFPTCTPANRWKWPSAALRPSWITQTRRRRKSLPAWRSFSPREARGRCSSSRTSWSTTATTPFRCERQRIWIRCGGDEVPNWDCFPLCVQTVPLQACLDLPTISLSTDSIDFGSCYVGKTKTVEVDLHSQGTYTSWTSIIGSGHCTFSADIQKRCLLRDAIEFDSVCFTVRIEADAAEPCVFRVTPEFGLMKFKNPQSTSWNQTLWISFTPRWWWKCFLFFFSKTLLGFSQKST